MGKQRFRALNRACLAATKSVASNRVFTRAMICLLLVAAQGSSLLVAQESTTAQQNPQLELTEFVGPLFNSADFESADFESADFEPADLEITGPEFIGQSTEEVGPQEADFQSWNGNYGFDSETCYEFPISEEKLEQLQSSALEIDSWEIYAQSDDLAQTPKVEKIRCTLFHVFGDDAEKLSIPKELLPYKSHLKRTLKKKFKSTKLSFDLANAKARTCPLPQGLGKVVLTLSGKNVSVVFKNAKGKRIASVSSRVWPVIIANDKLKKGSKQYIMILKKH